MLRLTRLVLTAALTAATVLAQGAATAPARFKELAAAQEARMKAVPRGDVEARNKALGERIADLQAFAKEFPKAAEAPAAALEIAQLAMMTKDEATAKAALAGADFAAADLPTTIRAMMAANTFKLTEQRDTLLQTAKAKAASQPVDARFELVTAIALGLKDQPAADALVAEIEASAKTDDDKAAVALGKAMQTRRSSGKPKPETVALLEAVAKTWPKTPAGMKAAAKLLAANLGPGSDPVPFTAKDLDGKDVSPADYKGKVLLIDFWATWCGPCMAELPHVLETYGELHDQGFEILGISLDRDTDKEKLVNTIKDRGMSWRHVYDGKFWQAEIAQLHDIQSIPATILIGKDGKIAGMNLRGDALKTAVKAALEAK
jgi:thiol-disulfide isomerase/thioredoxin